jgi:cellulose synthase/poly-beta-1,6-N-acetylglucosamine synthase-like glycosyltransferase
VKNPWARSIGYEIKNRYERIGKYTGRIATMNLLLKRSVIDKVGGWDENFPSQYDTDFGYRMSRLGYRIAYEPAAKCYHFNRESLQAYWRQQLQYGKNTIKLYFKHGQLARGDEITDLGMNLQPSLLMGILGFFVFGIVLWPLWIVSGAAFALMLSYYFYCAARISRKFHDSSAMRLVLLYFVRTVAWTTGALITGAKYLIGFRRYRQK